MFGPVCFRLSNRRFFKVIRLVYLLEAKGLTMTKEIEKKKVFRPRLDEGFADRIKVKYWEETKTLDKEQTIVWALERFLSFEESIKE